MMIQNWSVSVRWFPKRDGWHAPPNNLYLYDWERRDVDRTSEFEVSETNLFFGDLEIPTFGYDELGRKCDFFT